MKNLQYEELIAELIALRKRYDSRIFAATTLACAAAMYNTLLRAKMNTSEEIIDAFCHGIEMALAESPKDSPAPTIMTMIQPSSETKQ